MGLLFLMCSFPWKGGSARQDPETARALQREEAEGGPSSLSLGPSCLIQLDFRARFPLTWASVPPLSIGCALGPDIPGRQRCLGHAPLHPLAPPPREAPPPQPDLGQISPEPPLGLCTPDLHPPPRCLGQLRP